MLSGLHNVYGFTPCSSYIIHENSTIKVAISSIRWLEDNLIFQILEHIRNMYLYVPRNLMDVPTI